MKLAYISLFMVPLLVLAYVILGLPFRVLFSDEVPQKVEESAQVKTSDRG